jgi:cell division protein FtsL
MGNKIISEEDAGKLEAAKEEKVKETSRFTSAVQKMADFDFNISREWMVRQIPFALFVMFLLLVHIYNVHTTERIIRKTDKLNREIKELRSEYITILSELMSESKQSSVAQKLDTLGIKELITPPIKITY